MEVKKIINFCKKSGHLYLFDTDCEQWISDGYAFFPLFNLPRFDEESILKTYDIPEKKAEKMHIQHDAHLPISYNFENETADEMQCEIGGEIFGNATAITTSQGMMFINSKYLTPFADATDDMLYIFERKRADGQTYFAVKIGLWLVALVMPFDCVNEGFVKRLKNIYEQCEIALFNKQPSSKDVTEK